MRFIFFEIDCTVSHPRRRFLEFPDAKIYVLSTDTPASLLLLINNVIPATTSSVNIIGTKPLTRDPGKLLKPLIITEPS